MGRSLRATVELKGNKKGREMKKETPVLVSISFDLIYGRVDQAWNEMRGTRLVQQVQMVEVRGRGGSMTPIMAGECRSGPVLGKPRWVAWHV